jgi:hypothetical protein
MLWAMPQIEKCAPPDERRHYLAHRGTRKGSDIYEVNMQ